MENLFYFFPIIFIGMWILVTFILSKMGSASLTANYRSDATFIGKNAGIISASINGVNYKSSLVLKYNDQGIYLKPVVLFRLFHKPVLVPWSQIKTVRDKKVFFGKIKELIVGNPLVAVIAIQESTYRKIENYLVEIDKAMIP